MMKKVAKLLWSLLKLAGIAYVILFLVFFFDLDGKLLYYVAEPNLDAHFSKMKRPDLTGTPYEKKAPVRESERSL